MADVQFADILFILLACGVIFVILTLVNRSNKKAPVQDAVSNTEGSEENNAKTAEGD